MARIVCFAVDNLHNPDLEIRAANNYAKGDIVQAVEDGNVLGAKIVAQIPSKFIVVDTPGVSVSAIEQYQQSYVREVDYSVVNQSLSVDGYRVDVFSNNKTLSGKGILTRAQVEGFLNNWGAVVQSISSGSVRFDFSIYGIATCQEIWGENAPLTFSEDNYNQATGVHRITATYTNAPVSQRVMTRAETAVDRIGAVISNDPGSITFETTRVDMFAVFKEAIRRPLEKRFITRRFRVNTTQVDSIVAGGGYVTLTKAEAIAIIQDKAAE